MNRRVKGTVAIVGALVLCLSLFAVGVSGKSKIRRVGTSTQVTDMCREPSSPASMRMLVRSLCHSSTGASASRLTSTGELLADPPGRRANRANSPT